MIHYCPYCNTTFTANRKDKIYCSQSCKQMAFIKRQEGIVGFNYQNVNSTTTNRQVIERSIAQNVKPSTNTLTIDIEKLKEELYAFAELVIQDKLEDLIQEMNASTLQNVNDENEQNVNDNANDDANLFDDIEAQTTPFPPFQDEQLNQNVNEKNKTSVQEVGIKSSTPIIDGLNNTAIKTETLKPILFMEEDVFAPIKCKWIHELYERFYERGNDELFHATDRAFKDKANQVKRVSVYYRCLLECVITISEMKVVEWSDVAELCNAFTFLIESTYFNQLPHNYPFTKDIVWLRDKLKGFCLETQEEEWVAFRLKFDTKKELLLQRLELSSFVPKISFNQLQLDVKKENDKLVTKSKEVKEELEIKKSPEEKAWRRKFRESKWNG